MDVLYEMDFNFYFLNCYPAGLQGQYCARLSMFRNKTIFKHELKGLYVLVIANAAKLILNHFTFLRGRLLMQFTRQNGAVNTLKCKLSYIHTQIDWFENYRNNREHSDAKYIQEGHVTI